MIFRKHKAIISAVLAAAMTLTSIASVSAARTKEEKYGTDTYANRFMSLYDDVMTNGIANGYMSGNNKTAGNFGTPYHSVETMIVEAPDYGHETTSEAMSYIAWMAAMHDNLVKNSDGDFGDETMDFEDAWTTVEAIIPTKADQTGWFGYTDGIKATQADEHQSPEDYPASSPGQIEATNPYYDRFKTAYSTDGGYYLMNWIADVDNWYGYGGSGNTFTFINSFQRGEQESCWETVPHPSIETADPVAIKDIFNGPDTAAQWSYTNAPDAEDRAIQAVYWANRWGVGSSSVSTKAGKMSDQLRNDMFDKYYKTIGTEVNRRSETPSKTTGIEAGSSQHFLMAWYTAWGGSDQAAVDLYGGWGWQIGASHAHEFYQNPMAAYAKVYDSGISGGMKASGAVGDWETSLWRQLEFYEWLQASNGPFAGGATNSINGRYMTYDEAVAASAPSLQNDTDGGYVGQSTFYGMQYLPHPVYMDPGSNHWIGNQVWAVQRLMELLYVTSTGSNTSDADIAGKLKPMMDKWAEWATDGETIIIDENIDYGYSMVENLDWNGAPDTWEGEGTENSGLVATNRDYASGDIGVIASMANALIYYAVANDVTVDDIEGITEANVSSQTNTGAKALWYAINLMDKMWEVARDDIGLTVASPVSTDFLTRFFTQEVYVPTAVGSIDLPNGGVAENGATFLSIRPKYEQDPMYDSIKADWDALQADSSYEPETEFSYHRFWHMGDILLALGALAEYYPDITPDMFNDGGSGDPPDDPPKTEPTETEPTTSKTTKASTSRTTKKTTEKTDDPGDPPDEELPPASRWGDVDVNSKVEMADIVLLCQGVAAEDISEVITPQGRANADVLNDGTVDSADISVLASAMVNSELGDLPQMP